MKSEHIINLNGELIRSRFLDRDIKTRKRDKNKNLEKHKSRNIDINDRWYFDVKLNDPFLKEHYYTEFEVLGYMGDDFNKIIPVSKAVMDKNFKKELKNDFK